MPSKSGADDRVEKCCQLQQILINAGGGVKYEEEKNALVFYLCWKLDEG